MSQKTNSDKKKILKGVSLSWLKFFLTLAIGVVQTPLLFKHLSPNELNTWYIFFSFGAFLLISDLGLVSSISRIIAYLDNSRESQTDEKTAAVFRSYSIKQIYTTSLLSFSFFLIIFGIVISIAYYWVHYQGDPLINLSFVIFVAGIIFNLLSNVPTAVLNGHRDVGYDSIVRSVAQVVYFLSLLLFLPMFKSIVFVSCAFMVQNFLQFIVLQSILKWRQKKIFSEKLSWKEMIQVSIVKNVYSQSFPLAINQVGEWLTTQGSVFIASLVLGPNKLSDFVVNQQLFSYGIAISLVINQIIGPFIAKQYIENKRDNLVAYYKNTTIACLSIVSLFLAALYASCDNIIDIWVGPQHFLGHHFAIVFALITFFEVQHSVAGNFVWNMGKWPFNNWTVASGILNVVLAYILGKQMGLFGIALASFLSKIVTLNWYVVFYCLKKLGLGISNYLRNVLVPIVGSVLFTIGVVLYLKRSILLAADNELLSIIIMTALSSLIFAALTIVFFKKSLKPFLLMLKR